MKLSPLDIKRHSFEKGFRGYDPAEVDGFLKQVADQFESLQEELRLAHERTRETEGKLQHYERVEMALQEALESAKASAQRSEEDATRRAAVILEEAELRAQQVLQDAERERFGMRQDLVRLSSRQAEVAARLRGFLMSELEVLSDFQGDAPAGLLRMDEADPLLLGPADATPIVDLSRADADDLDADAPSAPADVASTPEATAPTPEAAPATAAPAEPFVPTADDTAGAPVSDDWDEPLDESPAPPYAPPASTTPLVDIGSRAHEDTLPMPDSEILGPPSPVGATDVPLSTGGWTAPEPNVSGSEAERERIRRILEDLD